MKAQNKKSTPKTNSLKHDDLGTNVVTSPDYVMRKHGYSAITASLTSIPFLIAAAIELILSFAGLFGPIADLLNKLHELIFEIAEFDKVQDWMVIALVTFFLIVYLAICWIKQYIKCNDVRNSTKTSFYRVKGGEGIVIHSETGAATKMFPLHGVTRVEKIHPNIGRLEVFLGLLKFDYQPLIKWSLNKKTDKLKDKISESAGEATLEAVKKSGKKAAKEITKSNAKAVLTDAAKSAAKDAGIGIAGSVIKTVGKNATLEVTKKIKKKAMRHYNYCDLKVTFVGAGEKIFYDVEDPDAFIAYISSDTYSPTSSVVYKVNKSL